jgi:dimethylhistidine N-methyltransferase
MSTRRSAQSDTREHRSSAFAEDVGRSLTETPRRLPSQYLYDALGSTLFEAICRLPWYRITVTEKRMLRAHRSAIFAALGGVETLVELGPGSGEKLVTLIDGMTRRDITVHLIDVSHEALIAATRTIAASADLPVVTHEATFEEGLARIAQAQPRTGRMLVLFLGSNIGNFDPAAASALLAAIREALRAGDALLLGTDLVKPEGELVLAYDDPLGVTAAFNRNLLVRMNRELGADFDLSGFTHRAVWNAAASRVEMYLVSTATQRVRIPRAALEMTFADGEAIWTESSFKYRVEELTPVLGRAGFRVAAQWNEDGFALTLATAT